MIVPGSWHPPLACVTSDVLAGTPETLDVDVNDVAYIFVKDIAVVDGPVKTVEVVEPEVVVMVIRAGN